MQTAAADPGVTFGAMIQCAQCGAPLTPVVTGQVLCDGCQGLAQPEPTSPLQQAEIAGYTLLRELGAGRHAQSWLAQDAQGTPVVLKLLRRYAPDAEAVQLFLEEAERLASARAFQHPNLARPLTAGVHLVSAFFLVYESGGEDTLADELRLRGRVHPARTLELCAQVCDGLSVIHREGVLHLDLKPANVALTRLADGSEQAVVLDFATGHLLAHAGLRDAALPLASAAYVSPEQAAGAAVDARSDLYALGVLLFQLVSGRLPFAAASAEEMLEAQRGREPLRLGDHGCRVHADVEALIARLLAKDPAHRPQNADELAVLLRALVPVADLVWVDAPPPAPVDAEPWMDSGPLPPPPQMLPPAVDPALERAMLGEAAPQTAPVPGIPRWVKFVPPRWWSAVAGALALVVVTVSVMLLARRAPQDPSVALASPAAPAQKAVVPAAVREAVRRDVRHDPPEDPTLLGQRHPRPQPEPPSPYAKNFERAQKALWVGHALSAETILRDLLHKPLSRGDRARAAKLMGDAKAKKGNKAAAAAWYRKARELRGETGEWANSGR